MEPYHHSLHLLGIQRCDDIPLQVLLSDGLLPGAYGIADDDLQRINALHDIVKEYTRPPDEKATLSSCHAVAELMTPKMRDLNHEEAWALYLTGANTLIDSRQICTGTLSSTLVDCRRIIKQALSCNAERVILVHNHPSGCPSPSEADIRMTEDLRSACKAMGISLLDHVIIAGTSYFSFSDDKTERL